MIGEISEARGQYHWLTLLHRLTFRVHYSLNLEFSISRKKSHSQLSLRSKVKCEMRKRHIAPDREWKGYKIPNELKWFGIAWQFHDLTPLKSKAQSKPCTFLHVACKGNLFLSHDLLVFYFSLSKRERINCKLRDLLIYTECGLRVRFMALYCSITFDRSQIKVHSSSYRLTLETVNEKGIRYQIEPTSLYLHSASVYLFLLLTPRSWHDLKLIWWTSNEYH